MLLDARFYSYLITHCESNNRWEEIKIAAGSLQICNKLQGRKKE
jgi:hypothetical protein